MKKIILNFLFCLIFGIFIFVLNIPSAQAAVTVKDVQTIVRTIGFIDGARLPGSTMDIIYDPSSDASLHDAKNISDIILKEGKGLHPRLVSVSDLSSLSTGHYAFLTEGLSSFYRKISEASRTAKIVSFTLDRDCVDRNCCTVYINSENRVEIVINKKVSDEVGANFKPVFLMMVTVQ